VKTLGLAIFADRLAVMRRAVPKLLPHVDDAFFLIDDRAHQEVVEFAAGAGIRHRYHDFEDHPDYALAYNTAADNLDTDWVFHLDADEDLDHPERLRSLVARAEAEGADLIGLPRRQWLDLRMKEDHPPYPDRQYRFHARHTRFKWRVHSGVEHVRKVADYDDVEIQHFNLAYRLPEDWEATNAFYARLLELDRADGRRI
jgi:glycosyltransferase involved in cell wall biosynthesis